MARHSYCDGECVHFVGGCTQGHDEELKFSMPGSWDAVQHNDWGFWRPGKCSDRNRFPQSLDPVTFSREEVQQLTAKATGGNNGEANEERYGEDVDETPG